jgi:hypothetical protein
MVMPLRVRVCDRSCMAGRTSTARPGGRELDMGLAMTSVEIEKFAKTLVEAVRENAIRNASILLRADARGPTAKRWKAAGVVEGPQTRVLIPDCVDAALFYLLEAIDEGALHLKVLDTAGRELDLTVEGRGELAGFYVGPDGWAEKYGTKA